MAATAAAKNKKIRQEALRDQLANQGHVQHVLEISDKLSDLDIQLEGSEVNRLKAAADIKLKLITKYLPDLKAVEIQSDPDDDAPSLNINFNIKEPVGEVKTTHGKPRP